MILPVVLSGGSGTRLWPISRRDYPKQFLPLVGENSMMQETVLRLLNLEEASLPLVVCNKDHRFIVAEQLHQVGVEPKAIILEPVKKNTAPAVATAALFAQATDEVLLVLAADHLIQSTESFHAAVRKAYQAALEGKLVTFGVTPQSPETGYGYIEVASNGSVNLSEVYEVRSFTEKPPLDLAKQYISSGQYLWNSGIFAFRASVYLEELDKHYPDMLRACEKTFRNADIFPDFLWLSQEEFEQVPSESIDYAVMEKTDKAVVVPLDTVWSDVGSWSALWEVSNKDNASNAVVGDVIAIDTNHSYIRAESKLVATIGMDNVVIVETDDAILVSAKERVQDVKKIVEVLCQSKRREAESHCKAYRPWGYFSSIDMGDRHQVKRIVVKPGGRLSLQMHHHRAEHWIVVKGTAKVVKGSDVAILTENQSTYIPVGAKHRLENPGVIPLEMIEVQTGSYLGEDDIVRLDDNYGRT